MHLQCDQPMDNPRCYNPLVLAHLGDAVYELMVRESLLLQQPTLVRKLHQKTVHYVCAAAQSKAVAILEPMLTEEELAVFKWGRNATGTQAPKNADPLEYRRATGLETLFGFLYCKGEADRLQELFAAIWASL